MCYARDDYIVQYCSLLLSLWISVWVTFNQTLVSLQTLFLQSPYMKTDLQWSQIKKLKCLLACKNVTGWRHETKWKLTTKVLSRKDFSAYWRIASLLQGKLLLPMRLTGQILPPSFFHRWSNACSWAIGGLPTAQQHKPQAKIRSLLATVSLFWVSTMSAIHPDPSHWLPGCFAWLYCISSTLPVYLMLVPDWPDS